MTSTRAIPFGSPQALLRYLQTPKVYMDTRQDIAIIMGGGGDPMLDHSGALAMCQMAGKDPVVFAANDQIAHFPYHVEHGASLHPEKLPMWTGARANAGYNRIETIWAHIPHGHVNKWTRDWAGSTGLFLVKVARELGFVHIILCGVPMTIGAKHFVRNEPWHDATGFHRGWLNHLDDLKPYVRSCSGWTRDLFGPPDLHWIETDIVDQNRLDIPPPGMKA